MKRGIISFLPAMLIHCAALAANEGVPVYYQDVPTVNTNQSNYGAYADSGYTKYIGKTGEKQVVGTRTYSYTTEKRNRPVPTIEEYSENLTYATAGTMTVNGLGLAPEMEPSTYGWWLCIVNPRS